MGASFLARACQDVAVRWVHQLQAQYVSGVQLFESTSQHGANPTIPKGELTAKSGGEDGGRGFGHHAQRVVDSLARHDADIARIRQLVFQRVLDAAVEDLFAGAVLNRGDEEPIAGLESHPGDRGHVDDPPPNILVNDPSTDQFPNITQIEPSLAVFGSNVVVAWNDSGHSAQFRTGVGFGLGYGYSTDGGSTFTDAGALGGSMWGGDPTVALDRFGDFFVGRFAPLADLSGVTVYKSVDRGVTFEQWARPFNFRGISDKPFVAVDTTGGQFDRSVYATWTDAASNILTIMLARSDDGGWTFSAPIRVSPTQFRNNQNSMPAIGPDGEVFVSWLAQDRDKIYVSKSTDGGLTFEPKHKVASFDRPGSRTCHFRYPNCFL